MVYKTKAVVCLIGVLISLILMPVGCLHYEINYKKTIRDKSLSADKVYELTEEGLFEAEQL